MGEWRAGRSVGRTLYLDDKLVGLVDTAELAAEIVETMNRVGQLLDEVRRTCGCDPAAGVECRQHMTMITDGSRRESGGERSLWSDPVYAKPCPACTHPAFMHRPGRCLGDFMSCACTKTWPPDAQRRSEATPQNDLQPCPKCGFTDCTADRQEPAF